MATGVRARAALLCATAAAFNSGAAEILESKASARARTRTQKQHTRRQSAPSFEAAGERVSERAACASECFCVRARVKSGEAHARLVSSRRASVLSRARSCLCVVVLCVCACGWLLVLLHRVTPVVVVVVVVVVVAWSARARVNALACVRTRPRA